MISLKSKREIEIMQKAGNILKRVFEAVAPEVKPGVSTEALDTIAEKVIRDLGGEPAFKGYRGFPKTACISVNEEVVHGIPSARKLQEGDLISFDIGARLEGYYSDAARTWPVGKISPVAKKLIETARGSVAAGLDQYRPGCRIGDVAAAIQQYIETRGFQVVRDYVGHGIGREIHEEPQVPNYGTAGRGLKIEPGMVLAIDHII